MNICIPVENDNGLDSAVCAHFGSAPAFMIVDTSNNALRVIQNNNAHHSHGMCTPLAAIQGEVIDGMVVGGIGMGALNKLAAANIRVYMAEHETVRETISAFNAGTLNLVQPGMACRGHDHH
jgi:predicted Fe-Mo cluster-binding NifX family protein